MRRVVSKVASVFAFGALALVASPAFAQDPCCASGPVVVYGGSPVPPVIPPTGYVLDPSDARPPIYVVNQGPVYSGPGIYAVPTFSEGGFAYRGPYPYVNGPVWGYGPGYGPYVGPTRPYGVPPYGAYTYLPAPSAKIIRVR